jgi:hypothetical protein
MTQRQVAVKGKGQLTTYLLDPESVTAPRPATTPALAAVEATGTGARHRPALTAML